MSFIKNIFSLENFRSLKRNKEIKYGIRRLYNLMWKKFFVTAPYPESVDIELSSRCNLNCIMCDHALRSGNGNIITFEQFKHIFNQFKSDWIHKPRFVMSGLGENALNPEFLKIFRYAKQNGADIKFIDNFTLIDENISKELIKMKIKNIQFSLDAATKETYEKVRIGANWETTTKNIKRLIELKKEMNSKYPIITGTFVILKQNYKEIPDFIKLMHKWGIEEVILGEVLIYDKHNQYKRDLLEPDYDSEDYKRIIEEAKALAKEYNIIFKIYGPPRGKSISTCPYPWYNVFISAEGNVFPCCHSVFPRDAKPKICMGNLYKENFNDIWNSERYKKFRKQIKSGKFPKLCEGCVLYG